MPSLYNTPLTKLSGIGSEREKLFNKIGINNVGELINFYPRDYQDWSDVRTIASIRNEEKVIVKAQVLSEVVSVRISGNRILSRTVVSDNTKDMNLVFFNNKYISSMLKCGEEYYFSGKATLDGNSIQMISPEFMQIKKADVIEPIYRLTAGLSNRVVINAVKEALSKLPDDLQDPLPSNIIKRFELCSYQYALNNIHFPVSKVALEVARKRLVFEELLVLNLGMRLLKSRNREQSALRMEKDFKDEFIKNLPFKLTNAQKRAITDCINDIKNKTSPMNRLVQGDVGSGKTVIAATVSFDVVKNGYQVAIMAPTEILAEQHYNTFSKLFEKYDDINIELLTGSTKLSEKARIKKELSEGDIDIIIGTHALITDDTEFLKLGCAITDEQHRFGVEQRSKLSEKGFASHILVLSATPIPRTLGLIIYGDLDISIVDELPPGRKEIHTHLIDSRKRQDALSFIRKQIDEGKQAYIVCPLVEEGNIDLEDVNTYAAELMLDKFSDCKVGILHGKLSSKEKEKIMSEFSKGEISLLVSTTVIEVGVDVKKANIMMIENAERFGLSQLHQLRGRIGRGEDESYCILVSDNHSDMTLQRLSTLVRTSNGFEIADEDLRLRGPGNFFGNKQHGLPDLKIADFTDMDSLRMSQSAAQEIINSSPDLSSEELSKLRGEIRLLYRNVTDSSLN